MIPLTPPHPPPQVAGQITRVAEFQEVLDEIEAQQVSRPAR
jgi:hypothetical protein